MKKIEAFLNRLFSPDGSFMDFLTQVADVLLAGVLWLVCSIPVVTVGASTAAMYQVLLNVLDGREDGVLRDFFGAFRRRFGFYTKLWLVLLALGLFFGLDLYFYYLWSAAGSWMGVVLFGLFAAASYTSASVPQMAIYGEYHDTDKDVCPRGLQLYGLGDGGGGPGYEHMERRRRSRNLKGTPPLEDEFVVDFFKRIEKNADQYRDWHGELYFERHQGTYTSMANEKKWNRTLEQDLHTLEWLSSLGGTYPRDWLYEAWQDVMLYQFHDCLPGSAIDRVYAQTQARYAQLHLEALHRIEEQKQFLAAGLNADGMEKPVAVFNPAPVDRTEYLERDGRELPVSVPAYGIAVVDLSTAQPITRTDRQGRILENDWIRLSFCVDGTVDSLYDKCAERELLPAGQRGNRLVCFPDENTHWDIEKAYLDRPGQPARRLTMERYDRGAGQFLHMTFQVGKASTITQTVCLNNHSARVDFRTEVSWQEEYQMLRVRWPVDVVAEQAACDIQFGHVFRPTHHNTSWDQAKFEVCAHKWADMSDRSGGLALLNDCKYGYKLWDNVLDLCLLRSQNCPCEHGDIGKHSFTYAVYPHRGDAWDGGVVREGYCLNYPLETVRVTPQKRRNVPGVRVLSGTVLVETIKTAEDSDRQILRLYEAAGGATEARIALNGWRAVSLCNLLEEPIDSEDLVITEEGARIHFHAFEIQTLLVEKPEELL